MINIYIDRMTQGKTGQYTKRVDLVTLESARPPVQEKRLLGRGIGRTWCPNINASNSLVTPTQFQLVTQRHPPIQARIYVVGQR